MTWASMEERIARTGRLAKSIMDEAELKAAAGTVSIDDAALARGAQLAQTAQERYDAQVALEGAWDKIRTKRKALRDEMVKTYMQHRRVAKLSIEDVELKKILDIAGERHLTVIEQHAQMTTFYTKGLSNPAALAELNRIGITRAMLEEGSTKLATISQLVDQELAARTKKERATDARDDALDAMDAWYDATLEGMAYATRENPALMNHLGE